MMKNILRLIPAVSLLTIFLASCNTDNTGGTPLAAFMLVHASPDAPDFDVYAGNQLIDTSRTYGTNTVYYGAMPNIYNFQFVESGTSNVVLNDFINFDGGKAYSIFVIDSLSKIKLAITNDEYTIPTGDSVRLRFLHFSPNAGSLDIVTNGGEDTLYLTRNFNDQAIASSLDDFITLPSGTYTLDLRDAGTTNIVYSLPSTTLAAGNVYTFYAKGFRGSGVAATDLSISTIKNNP